MISHTPHTRARRGLTLMEGAIYLGIVGLVMAAIWGAATTVQQSVVVNNARGQLIQIAQNMRSLYAKTQTFSGTAPFAAGSDVTPQMVNAEIFPVSMFNDGAALPTTPWQTPVTVSVGAAGALDTFVVTLGSAFDPLPEQPCKDLAISSIGSGRDTGLVTLTIDGTDYTGAALADLSTRTLADLATCMALTYTFSFRG